MERRSVLWLVPVLITIHNLEEALLMPALLERRNSSIPGPVQNLVPPITYRQFLIALTIMTAAPYVIAVCGDLRLKDGLATFLLLVFQFLMLVNVVGHVVMAVIMRGYAPGLVTALALNLPFSIYLLRRARREEWLSRRGFISAFAIGVLLHTPGLIVVLSISGRIADKF